VRPFAAAALLLFALPACAQDAPLGSRIRDPAAVVPEARGGVDQRTLVRQVMDQFGRCLVATRPRVADLFVSLPALAPETAKQIDRLDLETCLASATGGQVTLTMTPEALRGAIFRAAYARDHMKAAPVMPAPGPDGSPPKLPDWAIDIASRGGISTAEGATYVALRQLAACVVLAKPDIVHRLLLARTASADENVAFGEVAPFVGGCVPDGQTLKFSRQLLIGVLAEAMHRMAPATPD
jgi:hypothetical protein